MKHNFHNNGKLIISDALEKISLQGSITFTPESSIEVIVLSDLNGAYPITLAKIDGDEYYGVDGGTEYDMGYDFDEDEDEIVACIMSLSNEMQWSSICEVADKLTSNKFKFRKRYHDLEREARGVIKQINRSVKINNEVNFFDSDCFYSNKLFIAAKRRGLVDKNGNLVEYDQLDNETFLQVADIIEESLNKQNTDSNGK